MSTHQVSAKVICNLNWIHLYDEKQFTFLLEGSNRILSKTQKSFWSCSHMNCCLQNIRHINLHILYIIQVKTMSKIQELQESNKYINSYQQNKIGFLDKYYFNMYFI